MYSIGQIDGQVLEKIKRVHTQLGLIYGAYDLIERTDGEIVFLECNPDGPWLWLETATSLPIATCVAEYLCRHPVNH
jgi:hypothetical protein